MVAEEDIRILTSWYDRLEIAMKGIHAMNIYNLDESGFMLGEGKAQKVITANPIAAGQGIATGGQGESVTSIECIAADGWIMPPFFLLKGQWHMEHWYRQANLPDNYRIAPTPKGYILDTIALDWIYFFYDCIKH